LPPFSQGDARLAFDATKLPSRHRLQSCHL
jgi:hypothetical protein